MTSGRKQPWIAGLAVALLTACTGSSGETGAGAAAPQQSEGSLAPTVAGEVNASVEDFFANDATGAYSDVRAVLLVVDGRPVVERYIGDGAQSSANVASVTKSVMSILIGIAIDEGHLSGVEQTLGELLPDHAATMPTDVSAITLHHVLTMTAGLPEDGPGGKTLAEDPVTAAVTGALDDRPGDRFAYSSRGSHLLSAILVEATGRSTLDYAREKLFDPLSITTEPASEPVAVPENLPEYVAAGFAWPVDPQGHHLGDTLLKISPTDMLRIGQLMLAGGEWDGERIVSQEWVTESTLSHVSTDGAPNAEAYGYQWWVTTADGHPAYAAVGFGGQVIEVVPDLGLVLVVSTAIPEVPRAQGASFLALVDQVLAPILSP